MDRSQAVRSCGHCALRFRNGSGAAGKGRRRGRGNSMKTAAVLALAVGSLSCRAPEVPQPAPAVHAATGEAGAGDLRLPRFEGDVTMATIRGVQVIVQRRPGAERAAGWLCIRGGVRNWTAATAGIEKLVLTVAIEGGSTRFGKEEFDRKLSSIGAEMAVEADVDFSALTLEVANEGWDEGFALLADAFLVPAFPASEIEGKRQVALSSLRHEREDPSELLWALERRQVFSGHPYANWTSGNIETLSALRAGDL